MAAEHKQVFRGRHVTNRLLTGPGSGKITRHHEISLEGAPVTYLPGDALGLYPINDPALVEQVIEAIGATGDETVETADGTTCTLRDALAIQNLNTPTRRLIELYVSKGVKALEPLLEKGNAEQLKLYISGKDVAHDVLDVIQSHPDVRITPAELMGALRRLLRAAAAAAPLLGRFQPEAAPRPGTPARGLGALHHPRS